MVGRLKSTIPQSDNKNMIFGGLQRRQDFLDKLAIFDKKSTFWTGPEQCEMA